MRCARSLPTPTCPANAATAAKFSFNGGDGRCPTCGGSGFEHIEMQFLSDVYLRCPDCDGKRYRPEILEVTIERGRPKAQRSGCPDLTVSEAAQLFKNDRDVIRALQPIVDVGLEYVKLGQPVPTPSGGEAQRLKIAGFLADAAKAGSSQRQALARKGTLFMLDEFTTGLRFRRHRQADARTAQTARRGPFTAGDRAQPGRDSRQRLAH